MSAPPLRFSEILAMHRFDKAPLEATVTRLLEALAAQEAIRESVPVRSPAHAGPTLKEQIAALRAIVADLDSVDDAYWKVSLNKSGVAAFRAILATLEAVQRRANDGRCPDPTLEGQLAWLYQEMGAAGAAGRGVEAKMVAGIIERLERLAREGVSKTPVRVEGQYVCPHCGGDLDGG